MFLSIDLLDRMLSALSGDDRIAVPVVELAEALALELADVDAAIRQGETAGLIEAWDRPSRIGVIPVVSFTPLTAERLGLRAHPGGKRWLAIDAPRPRREHLNASRAREKTATDLYGDVGLDAHPAKPRPEEENTPTYLLGLDVPLSAIVPEDEPCPGCADQIRPGCYCLHCDEPKGSLVSKAKAAARRSQAKAEARLRGGTSGGRQAG